MNTPENTRPKKKYKVSEHVKNKHRRVLTILAENGGVMPMGKALQKAGYSATVAKTPGKVTNSRSWQELLQEQLPDSLLAEKHNELLQSKRLDHMTFPPFNTKSKQDGQEGEDFADSDVNTGENHGENLTDTDIRELLKDVSCTVRRIVHGEQARHVYFWSSNDKAKKDALEMAYKLKGRFDEKVNIDITRKEVLSITVTEITHESVREQLDAPLSVPNTIAPPRAE